MFPQIAFITLSKRLQDFFKNYQAKKELAGGLRAETRPPGQEEGSGRDRPTRGLWDSLSFAYRYSKRNAKAIF
jgi:hypothetical protein